MKRSAEEKEKIANLRQTRDGLNAKIFELDRSNKNKSIKLLKQLIKLCKDYEKYTNELKSYGYKVELWHKTLRQSYWEEILKSKTAIEVKPKKQAVSTDSSLYYIMLCWTANKEFFVCDTIINTVRLYFEKLKLEFMDTSKDEFPDRTEFVSTYKIKTTQEVYNTIMNSAEFIIDNNTTSIHEKCNVGVFGKKIE